MFFISTEIRKARERDKEWNGAERKRMKQFAGYSRAKQNYRLCLKVIGILKSPLTL